ncbi:hypothetical protein EVJ29_12425 [Exiguobacterium sp. SH4S7]|nr:hypothetical protein [Exiguobacterium sp. SH4S7]TCI34026.1 hypothetical protein EVJ29_12425 [Exiguobacterium sp. SH4S7]
MRELMAFDNAKKPSILLLSWVFFFVLFFMVEYKWLSPVTVFFIGAIVSLPDFYKARKREAIKKKYLISREAKRLIHFNSISGLLMYPFILLWVYAVLTDLISISTFFLIGAASFLFSFPGGKWYERHMVNLDNNYVTEDELREERKWGSA